METNGHSNHAKRKDSALQNKIAKDNTGLLFSLRTTMLEGITMGRAGVDIQLSPHAKDFISVSA